MIKIIIDLLIISAIVSMVYLSGFWDNMDYFLNKHLRSKGQPFYHLPYIFSCCLCQTMWLSVLYIVITGNLSLLTLALCLANATLNKVLTAIIQTIENYLFKIIELINKPVN